jgi:ribosomal protein S18 acetylase RimI-like enzyme
MTIRNLENVARYSLCDAFNLAFSTYVIPVQLSLPLLEEKLKAENVCLTFSMGAFEGSVLAGFALHGADSWPRPAELYNGGTGVIPAFRRQHLVQRMYAQFTPWFREQGVRRIILEVIASNEPARKAYAACGFRPLRLFHCYKGTPVQRSVAADISIHPAPHPQWELLGEFADQQPSWPNSIATIQREGPHTATWVAYRKGEAVGFISIYKGSKRIRQLAVRRDARRHGIGSALLQHAVQALQGPFSIINITDDNKGLQQFLLQAGFTHTLSQYEMEMLIS